MLRTAIHRPARLQRARSGFSLIEVIVAIAVITIALGTLTYLVTALRNSADSDEQTEVANFARTYMDVLRSQWQLPTGVTGYHRGANPSEAGAVLIPMIEPPAGIDSYTVQITSFDATRSNNLPPQTFTYQRPTNGDPNLAAAEYTLSGRDAPVNDVIRRVIITVRGRDGEDVQPFVTWIIAPTV